ncbi:MAG TPA: hypothetical protein H9896_04360 [Candidatus Pygmaiobacter gallistercoris]|nr:hypothetical protein [Candidatus Pygmaiobacter gallistercoris]
MKTIRLNRAFSALIAAALITGLFAGALRAAAAEVGESAPVLISRAPLAPIPAGGGGQLTLQFENRGDTPLKNPIATVTPSEGLTLWGAAFSFALDEIAPGGTGSITFELRAAATAAAAQSVGVELRFVAPDGAQQTASDRIPVPVEPRPAVVQPTIAVSRSGLAHPIRSGEPVTLNLTFENRGDAAATGMSASLSPTDGINLLGGSATLQLPDLAPGKSAVVPVRLQGAREIASEGQALSVELRFAYESAGVPTAASQSDRLNLPAAVSTASTAPEKTDAPVPNIVVKSFTFGDKPAEAGGKFPLSVVFENTGVLRCENIVVTVDGGESFTVDGGTNTLHYKALGAGATLSQTLNMQTVPAAKSGAQPISISFKYEYLDGARRASVSSELRLTVPVSQPNRFEVTPPAAPTLEQGSEGELIFSYVNKGKGEIANLEAELVGKGFVSPAASQYLGNVAPGSSGNIGFALTPDKTGKLKLTVKIRYEDADQNQQTAEFPLTVEVSPAAAEEPFDPVEEPAQSGSPVGWILLAVVLLGAAGAAVLVAHRLKKAAVAAPDEWDWSVDEEE